MNDDRLLVSEHNHLVASSITLRQDQERSINIPDFNSAQGGQERSNEGNLIIGECDRE